jgi:hypothetical protein
MRPDMRLVQRRRMKYDVHVAHAASHERSVDDRTYCIGERRRPKVRPDDVAARAAQRVH